MRPWWTTLTCVVALGCATAPEPRPADRRADADASRPRVAPEVAPVATRAPDPRIDQLEARIADLEDHLRALQAQLDRVAQAPHPPPRLPRRGPDPSTIYAVPLDDSPAIGPASAPVTMVASLQFPEPYTHKVYPVLQQLRGEYAKQLRIVVKTYVVHPRATASSIAGCAAAYQGQLEAFELAIYDAAQQPPPTGAPATGGLREIDPVESREIARALRLDLRAYDRDLATCTAAATRDQAQLARLGQSGVPMFWINGRPLSGAQGIEAFRALIEEELAKAKADRARGGKAADYYDRIVKSGVTSAP